MQVDVSVLDRERRPVGGLTADDFLLFDNGDPQPIVAFSQIENAAASKLASRDEHRAIPSDVSTNALGDRRLVVLFLDDSGYLDQIAARTVKEIGRSVLAQLGPDDLAAVVFHADPRASQDFTADHSRLLAAVEKYRSRAASTPLSTLEMVTRQLADVPGRRKVVFYVSAGHRFDPALLNTKADRFGGQSELLRQIRRIFSIAQIGNVTINTFDPTGLTAPSGASLDPTRLEREFLQMVARETGGRAVVSHNAPAGEVPRVFQESGLYYLMGFRASDSMTETGFRRIEVRTRRSELEIRARTGYYVSPSDVGSVEPSPSARSTLAGLAPDPELPLTLTSASFARRPPGKPLTILTISVQAPPSPEIKPETVTLAIAAFDLEGRPRGSWDQEVKLRLPAANHPVRYEIQSVIDLLPGSYRLRVGAHATERDKRGSVFGDLLVPDFAKEALTVSGLTLQSSSPLPSLARQLLDGLIPTVPTAERMFKSGDELTAFLRVYQGGTATLQPVAASFSISGPDGATAWEQSQMLGADLFSDVRSADLNFTIPLARLAPGVYAATFTASIRGTTTKRHVRFELN